MSETTTEASEAPKYLEMYDIKTDRLRPMTWDDIDEMGKAKGAYIIGRVGFKALMDLQLACIRDEISEWDANMLLKPLRDWSLEREKASA